MFWMLQRSTRNNASRPLLYEWYVRNSRYSNENSKIKCILLLVLSISNRLTLFIPAHILLSSFIKAMRLHMANCCPDRDLKNGTQSSQIHHGSSLPHIATYPCGWMDGWCYDCSRCAGRHGNGGCSITTHMSACPRGSLIGAHYAHSHKQALNGANSHFPPSAFFICPSAKVLWPKAACVVKSGVSFNYGEQVWGLYFLVYPFALERASERGVWNSYLQNNNSAVLAENWMRDRRAARNECV